MMAEKQEKVGKRFATDGCGIKARKGNGEYKKSQASKQKGDVDRINLPRASSCLIFHLIVSIFDMLGTRLGGPYRRWPGTAQKSSVKAVTNAVTSTLTQMARPTRSFFTYGSRMVSVRKGVVSDWPKKTRIGSSSY